MTDELSGNGGNRKAEAGPASALAMLPILVKQNDHPCFSCAMCCHYVALEIDRPTTAKEYDYVVWYLMHQGVGVFVDWEDDWYVKFDTRCENLTDQGLCGVYDDRPVICREFDWRDCEKNNPEDQADKQTFSHAQEFLDWLETKRPKQFEKYMKWKTKKSAKGEEAELVRVESIESPAPE